MPTNPERMVWGMGDATGLKVVDTPAGRLGSLIRLLYVPPEPGQEYRHNDLLDPVWNMLDLAPEGRGDFQPKLDYTSGSGK